MIFMKTLMNKIQIKNAKPWSKIQSIVPELFIRGRKVNISLVFITQFYYVVPKKY